MSSSSSFHAFPMKLAILRHHKVGLIFDRFAADLACPPKIAAVVVADRGFPWHQRPHPELARQVLVAIALSGSNHHRHALNKCLGVVPHGAVTFLGSRLHVNSPS